MESEKIKTNNYNHIMLGDLLTTQQIKSIKSHFNNGNKKEVRQLLNSKEVSETLEKKGVIPDYLYYFLEYKFNA